MRLPLSWGERTSCVGPIFWSGIERREQKGDNESAERHGDKARDDETDSYFILGVIFLPGAFVSVRDFVDALQRS